MRQAKLFGKVGVWALALAGALLLGGCGQPATSSGTAGESATLSSASPETADDLSTEETEEAVLQSMEILVGDTSFTVQLADTEAARELARQLPLELAMQELNGNEKYGNLPSSLPTDAIRPDAIRTGDLMLFGSDCLVLFYKDFSTSYSYTPIGRVDDPRGLPEALGTGQVAVTFRVPSSS